MHDPTSLNILEDLPLSFGLIKVPFVIVADDAFTFQRHLLNPFAGNARGVEHLFNYSLSRAAKAFGIA